MTDPAANTTVNRWQLNRAGIVNVYQYDNETFEFSGGRLLLRGINGSGKSTAMNMLLPFLLTGRTRGIDAAGEQTGVLKSWMLSGRDEEQPVGYLWIEFARTQPDADADNFLTLGCGIKANRSSDTINTWWFVSSRRPGIDLQLVEQNIPLSANSLGIAIEPDPVFSHGRRADYRREVRRRLYGNADLDPYLQLLNTVRNPRVGDRIDVDLPAYLVASLPSLSEQALIEAARPLDDLDEHRRNVGDLQKTAHALGAIGEVYHQYVLTELSRVMTESDQAVSVADSALKAEARASKAVVAAQQLERAAKDKLLELETSIRQLTEEINALRGSSAYTEGQQLEDLRASVDDLVQRVERQQGELHALDERLVAASESVRQQEHRLDSDSAALSSALDELRTALQTVALEQQAPALVSISRSLVPGTDFHAPDAAFAPVDTNDQLNAVAGGAQLRKSDIASVRKQLDRVDKAQGQLGECASRLEYLATRVESATIAFENARRDVLQAVTLWQQQTHAWAIDTVGLCARQLAATPGIHRIAAGSDSSVAAGSPEITELQSELQQEVTDVLEQERVLLADLHIKLTSAEEKQADCQRRLDELHARKEPDRPSLPWQQQSGPGFADLVDFKASLSSVERAGLEAALEASGLLSASLSWDGLRLSTGELVVQAAEVVSSPLSEKLLAALPAESVPGVDASQVLRVLNGISTDTQSDAQSAVTTDGEFRLGSLCGKHSKQAAEFVGVSARRERLQRLRDEARAELEAARTECGEMGARHKQQQQLCDQLVASQKALPSLRVVSDARVAAESRERQLDEATLEKQDTEKRWAELDRELAAISDELDRVARTLRLPADRVALQLVEQTLESIIGQCASARLLVETLGRSCRDWTAAIDRWKTVQQDRDKATEQLIADKVRLERQSTRLATLDANIGKAYHQVVAALEVSQASLNTAETAMPRAREGHTSAIHAHADANGKAREATDKRRDSDGQCARAHAHLCQVLAVPGLIELVNPPLAGTDLLNNTGTDEPDQHETRASGLQLISTSEDTQGLRDLLEYLVRHITQPVVDATTADSVRASLRRRRDSLGAGWDAEDRQPDPALPAAISVNGPLGQMSLADAIVAVRAQLEQLTSLLTQKQDQALRTLLQGLIAREVAEKMFQATELVARMNERLGSVTTTHGIGVRLRWRHSSELDESTARSVAILAKLPDLRSEAEEAELRNSLSSQLDEARRLEPDAPYRDLIARVFDYTQWHDMSVLLRRAEEPERRLSRKTPLSEGEKKLVTYLPLFAAVAAACDGLAAEGGADVPRFVLLDDAFAKVSEDNHAGLFGLLVDLELDFIATSERLWGTHATVPMLAITEVVRDNEAGVILLEHSRWNGNQLSGTTH